MALVQFLLMFREGLEAALILGIIAAYLVHIGRKPLLQYVWYGTLAAILASLVVGGIIWVTAGGLEGIAEEAFEGAAALIAVGVLTYMIFWMARNSRLLKGELEKKIDQAISRRETIGITVVAFVAVFREGIETVLFLTPLALTDANATILGIVAGLIVVIVLAYLMYAGGYRLNIRRFFTVTSILLIVFAAGLVAVAVHEFNEVYAATGVGIPPVVDHVYDVNPYLPEKGTAGLILKSLVGYNGNPSLTEVVAYLVYWALVGSYALWVYGPPKVKHWLSRLFPFVFRTVPREKIEIAETAA